LKIPLFTKIETKAALFKELMQKQESQLQLTEDNSFLLLDATSCDEVFRINIIAPGQLLDLGSVEDAFSSAVLAMLKSNI